jgi:hypothetical protein
VSPHSHQNTAIIIVMVIAALTGGTLVHVVERAPGIRVQLGPDGDEIQVWNATTSDWEQCSIIVDGLYAVEASGIPRRTLVILPRHLFEAPEGWEPRRAVVRCSQPRAEQWMGPVLR